MNRAVRQYSALPVAQRGAVVLLLLLILAVSTASYFLVKRLNSRNIDIKRDQITAAALAQAKIALIGYAAADSNRPGELPCPDIDNDGKITVGVDTHPGTNCANVNFVGRLPWHRLRLPDLRDGHGERLWYALSDNFHATGSTTTALNTSTNGQLSVSGISPANAVIAIVFSPGPALGGQIRDGLNSDINSAVNSVMNYLEGENANGGSVYETRNTSDTFNDKLLTITFNDLFFAVTHRVASEIGIQLTPYFSGTLPGDLSFILEGNWLHDQGWTSTAITTYTPSSTSPPIPPALPTATLKFSNCPSLTYTIEFVNNRSKTTVSGHSC